MTCCDAGAIFCWDSLGLSKTFEHFPQDK